MRYVKHNIELILILIFVAGILKAYLLPAIALLSGIEFIWIPGWISTPVIGQIMTISMGVLPLIGIVNFYLHEGKLEKREPRLVHWIYLTLMLFGAFFAVGERIFIRIDSLFQVLWVLSDTLPSGVAFGLLIPFYKVEKERRLLLFFLPLAFFYVGAPFAGIAGILIPQFFGSFVAGLPQYQTPFWLDAWFWSDAIVNIGCGAFVFWALLKNKFETLINK